MTRKQKKILVRICISLPLLIVLLLMPIKNEWLRAGLFLLPYFCIGYDILIKAVKGIVHLQPFDENFLMAAATVGAILLGEYAEGVAVMLFYQIGELFQSIAVGKSRRNISALMDIRPDCANLEGEDGSVNEVEPDEVAVGSVIVVRPGEKIPIDGVVLSGESALNTVSLTGESLPRVVCEGDEVISGCINLSGLLRVRTTKPFGESTVSKILDLVENASAKKSRSEQFISKFARVYTPAVCLSALVLAVLPPVVRICFDLTPTWGEWIYRALTFLVISCPCALVISIPLTFFGGIGGASRAGILIKGSNYMETLSRVGYVALDKTGTLTRGSFEVVRVESDGIPQEALLEYAALAEQFSTHPIASGLRDALKKPLEGTCVTDVTEISGEGVCALVGGVRVCVGNEKLMQHLGVTVQAPQGVGTVVYVALDGKYAGAILLADRIKETAKDAITALSRAGVRQTVMLTGDAQAVGEAVGQELGLDGVVCELLPQDKLAVLERMLAERKKGERLAFVGDGINDAPVLSRADVGIAMGAMGADAAIEAADVVLMDDDPRKVAKAIHISRKCMRIVRQNIAFALGIKALCLILGGLGIANMWLAIFADVGVMVLAVLNAIRALK
ncbi:MAG: cadmium-translocating P-type ATPase [Clostridia bacterium]|nr:cadmium-translocating P-type ATPase [Clostridia bacterium]